MIVVLWVIGLAAGASTALGLVDLMRALRPGATATQLLTARVDVGLGLLVFVTALGFAGVIRRLEFWQPQQAAPDKAQPAPRQSPSQNAEPLRSVRRNSDI